MKSLILFLAFVSTLMIPFSVRAQWTYTPGYQVGVADWTFDSAFQAARKNSLLQPNTLQTGQFSPGQRERIDPRTVRRIDQHEDITGYGRFNIIERPVIGY